MIEPRKAAAARVTRALIGVLLAALAVSFSLPSRCDETLGAGSGLGNDYQAEEKPWQEEPVRLPAWPRPADLLEVPLPPRDTLRLRIDGRSLARGADGVVRYVLVVETPGGARNVFFEGIRCETREYKTYAVGATDRRWQALEKPQWRKIPYFEVDAFRYHLYRYVLCDEHSSPRSPREITHGLAAGLPE